MRVLVCGGRGWTNKDSIKKEMEKLPTNTIIIEGEAKGADTLARLVAEELGFKVEKYPADWDKYGKSAGPIRNRQMLTDGKPELILAFHEDILSSKGTADMIKIARKSGIEIKLIGE